MDRNKIKAIIEKWWKTECSIVAHFDVLADAIMEELNREGKIHIADGWVDPKSTTPVWHVATDLSRMDELPALNRTFARPLRNFLSREKAEAFLKSERERTHWGQVQIGNGKWIDKESAYFYVHLDGIIEHSQNHKAGTTRESCRERCFATLAEAEAKSEEIHKGLGHVKVADGWVSADHKCFCVSDNGIYSCRLNVTKYPDDLYDSYYSTPESAAAAWVKLVKETK